MLGDYFLERDALSLTHWRYSIRSWNPSTIHAETEHAFRTREEQFCVPLWMTNDFRGVGEKGEWGLWAEDINEKAFEQKGASTIKGKDIFEITRFLFKKKQENKRKGDRERDRVDTSLWADKEVYGWSVKKFYTDELRTIGTTAITTMKASRKERTKARRRDQRTRSCLPQSGGDLENCRGRLEPSGK